MIKLVTMTNTKLIAITANTSWYLFNFRSNLIKALIAEGYNVLAIAPADDYSERLSKIGNQVRFRAIKIDQGGTNPFRDFLTAVSFFNIYRKERPEIVLNFTPKNNIYSTLAASRFKIRVINNVAGLGSVFIDEGYTASIARWLYQASQKYASRIFFQNEEDMNLFLNAKLVDTYKTERLPGSGVDLTRFTIAPLPQENNIRFILIARLLYEKGIEEYVMAAKALKKKFPQVECRLVGFLDMKNPSAIPRHVIDAWHQSGYINYRGSTDQIEEEISQAHCIVLPSYYREGVPRSLLEGAAMGRVVITTRNVGCQETVEHGKSGYLCEPRDCTSLLNAMESAIHLSREELNKMAINSRELVEKKFDEKIVINRYLNCVNNRKTE